MEDLGTYFQELNGRRFHNQGSVYSLPADDNEFWRLNKQHAAFLAGLGDLYPCSDQVERALTEESDKTKRILDLGCGTGAWAISMAQRFPHTQVLGIDLIPPTGASYPSNIQFVIEDFTLGLPLHVNSFDLVQMRCVGGGLLHYGDGVNNAIKCLKEGGLMLLMDMDVRLRGENMVSPLKMRTDNRPEGSWLARLFYEYRWAHEALGFDVSETYKVLEQGLWGYPSLERCGGATLFLPVGPWAIGNDPEETQRLALVGTLMRDNLKNALRGVQTLMKKAGIKQEFLDDITARCDKELDELSIHSWMRLRMFWGYRKSNQMPLVGPEETQSQWKPNNQTHVYRSLEESLAAVNEEMGELPVPQTNLASK